MPIVQSTPSEVAEGPPPVVDLTLQAARAVAVPHLRRLVCAFCAAVDVDDARAHAVGLCVTEAATNVVRHAYEDGSGPLRLVADYEGSAVEVLVEDRGSGLSASPSRDPGLGLGLALIAGLSSRFDVQPTTPDGGTTVWMRFEV